MGYLDCLVEAGHSATGPYLGEVIAGHGLSDYVLPLMLLMIETSSHPSSKHLEGNKD